MAHDHGHNELAAFLEQRTEPLPGVVAFFQEFARRAHAVGKLQTEGRSRGFLRPRYRYAVLAQCSREPVTYPDSSIPDKLFLRDDGVPCRKSWKPETGDVYTPQPGNG
jgi:hypothetical protein